MSDKPTPVRSLNSGIVDEMHVTPLDDRIEMSPIGILDALIMDSELCVDGADEIKCTCRGDSVTKCNIFDDGKIESPDADDRSY